MKTTNIGRGIRVAALALSTAAMGFGTAISITNPGFEADVIPVGTTSNTITGWTASGSASTFHPGPAQFSGGAAEGSNVLAVDNGVMVMQTLSATLQPDFEYTLVVEVGQRADYGLSGFLISLDAGGVLLASSSSPIPAQGSFTPVTVTFLSQPGDPNLGQALSVILATTGNFQAEFDAVALDGTSLSAAPEPGTWLLLGGGA
jgi:hypothetical protein